MEHRFQSEDLNPLSPERGESMTFIEQLRWGKTPVCPYCGSKRVSRFKHEPRFHCNSCNRSFSATVNTIFHNTHIPLQKWFRALLLFRENRKPLSVRRLAAEIGVSKNTAFHMLSRLKQAFTGFGDQIFPAPDRESVHRNAFTKTKNIQREILRTLVKQLLEFT